MFFLQKDTSHITTFISRVFQNLSSSPFVQKEANYEYASVAAVICQQRAMLTPISTYWSTSLDQTFIFSSIILIIYTKYLIRNLYKLPNVIRRFQLELAKYHYQVYWYHVSLISRCQLSPRNSIQNFK